MENTKRSVYTQLRWARERLSTIHHNLHSFIVHLIVYFVLDFGWIIKYVVRLNCTHWHVLRSFLHCGLSPLFQWLNKWMYCDPCDSIFISCALPCMDVLLTILSDVTLSASRLSIACVLNYKKKCVDLNVSMLDHLILINCPSIDNGQCRLPFDHSPRLIPDVCAFAAICNVNLLWILNVHQVKISNHSTKTAHRSNC